MLKMCKVQTLRWQPTEVVQVALGRKSQLKKGRIFFSSSPSFRDRRIGKQLLNCSYAVL
jgi:hypothetical protein